MLANWGVMDGPAEAVVDLAAISGNVAALRSRIAGPQLMAVVKADGYGHGMLPRPGPRWPAAPTGWASCMWPKPWRCARTASPAGCWR